MSVTFQNNEIGKATKEKLTTMDLKNPKNLHRNRTQAAKSLLKYLFKKKHSEKKLAFAPHTLQSDLQ